MMSRKLSAPSLNSPASGIRSAAHRQHMDDNCNGHITPTGEQRKQRNRQAQAAFRERRTGYIRELEKAAERHQADLQRAQAAHTKVADELLMLRYKNSLLERILLENDIDVQAELSEKTEASDLDLGSRAMSTRPRPSTLVGSMPRSPAPRSPQATMPIASPPSLILSPRGSVAESIDGAVPSLSFIQPPQTPHFGPEAYSTSGNRAVISQPAFGSLEPNRMARAAWTPRNYLGCDSVDAAHKETSFRKAGSLRDAASFYLSSFLRHIESLEKESEGSPPDAACAVFDAVHGTQQQLDGPTDNIGQYEGYSGFADLFEVDF